MFTSRVLFVVTLLLSSVFAGGSGKWNYLAMGSDWEEGVCAKNNNEQSPVDLMTTDVEVLGYTRMLLGQVQLANGKVEATLVNNGHSIQLNNIDKPFVTCSLEDSYNEFKDYEAAQFHFHSPSEHWVKGEQMDLEMHIVMNNMGEATNGRVYGVLGFLFVEDDDAEDSAFFEQIIDHMEDLGIGEEKFLSKQEEHETDDSKSDHFEFKFEEFSDLLPDMLSGFWHYEGGLTTPTCDEAVNWYVNQNILSINSGQLENFRNLWVNDEFNGNEVDGKAQGNNRELQDLGDRVIFQGEYEVLLGEEENGDGGKDEEYDLGEDAKILKKGLLVANKYLLKYFLK